MYDVIKKGNSNQAKVYLTNHRTENCMNVLNLEKLKKDYLVVFKLDILCSSMFVSSYMYILVSKYIQIKNINWIFALSNNLHACHAFTYIPVYADL